MNPILDTALSYALRCLIFLVISIAIFIVLQSIRISKAPHDIPWVGLKNRRFFPKLRACLSELTAGQSMLDEGYEKYGKHNLPFILPSMLWNAIVLPPSNAVWIAQQPDSILSGNTTMDELMGLGHLTHGPNAESCRDFTVIRRDLTRQFMRLSGQVYEEIQAAFDDELVDVGEDEWTEVKLQRVLLNVAFRAGNRIFVGLPMCRDKAYKKAVDRWTQAFGISTMMLRFLVPEQLRDVFLRIAAIPTKYLERRAARFFLARIEERLVRLRGGEEGPKEQDNDMMQWIIDQNASKTDSRELESGNIAAKMILLNIFATATTGVQSGTTIFNLLTSSHTSSIIPQLHAEAIKTMPRILEDQRKIREMHKLDSLIRETLRYHPMTPQGLVRQVVQPGGLTSPEGVYLPEGTHVHSIVKNMHHDSQLFGEGADEFDPLRYYKPPSGDQKSAVHISSDFLPWGLGKHACPGRFFAVHVMKLMLGHLFLKYDFEPLKEKPKPVRIGDMEFPSEEVVVRMRRREGEGSGIER
ncbi:hypothetical protein M409DRAFT_64636 [Zasmidium cellare ATCC 36951]|uniref:Cytochrome P450 n=1 Tax=Zasmidium cellare ATCC 36951 TaxID=1080233 RepID=A0A6A6CUN7_ZASCE|nr:uncharacterized protein M409DRAFT_64636 [Zasmidium cellare ATCC 36951]KAF2169519.1 hypothetical protein M409DRAFT_64636 [Zasmidium cellare ATCC 36951]